MRWRSEFDSIHTTRHQKAVFKVTEELVHRVSGDGNALRLERGVEFFDAEQGARIPEQVAHEPPERSDIADSVTFHHVAKNRNVHVVRQQLMPRPGVQPLRFRKSTGNKPYRECLFQPQALVAGKDIRAIRNLDALMAKGLVETERVHEHLPRPTAQGRGDLERQQRRRGAGNEYFHGLHVQ